MEGAGCEGILSSGSRHLKRVGTPKKAKWELNCLVVAHRGVGAEGSRVVKNPCLAATAMKPTAAEDLPLLSHAKAETETARV